MLDLYSRCQILIDNNVCTADEISLVADINGYNDQLIEDILYSREGYNDLDDGCADNDINIRDYEEYE